MPTANKEDFDATEISPTVASDPSSLDANGNTPLHLAAMAGNGREIKDLFALGTPSSRKNIFGRTVLHEAAIACDEDTILFLINHLGLNPSAPDSSGKRPLQLAIESNNLAAIQALKTKANFFHTDANGRIPLHYAAEFGNEETLAAVLEISCAINPESHNVKDKKGITPSMLAKTSQKKYFLRQDWALLIEKYFNVTQYSSIVERDELVSAADNVIMEMGADTEDQVAKSTFIKSVITATESRNNRMVSAISPSATESVTQFYNKIAEQASSSLDHLEKFGDSLKCVVSSDYLNDPILCIAEKKPEHSFLPARDYDQKTSMRLRRDTMTGTLITKKLLDPTILLTLHHFIFLQAKLSAALVYSRAKLGDKDDALQIVQAIHSNEEDSLTVTFSHALASLIDRNPTPQEILKDLAKTLMIEPNCMCYNDTLMVRPTIKEDHLDEEAAIYSEGIASKAGAVNYTLKGAIEAYRVFCAQASLDIAQDLVRIDRGLAKGLIQHANNILEPMANENIDLDGKIKTALCELAPRKIMGNPNPTVRVCHRFPIASSTTSHLTAM